MLTVDSPGRIDAWSMFKVVLCCSILWGLDSTALEHPFLDGSRPSPHLIRPVEKTRIQRSKDTLTCIQGRSWLSWLERGAQEASAFRVRQFCFLTPTSILSRVEDLVRVPHPGTWPETHPADSGWEFGGFMTASRQPRWRSSGRS